jgi:hypothetical protein
MAREQMLGIMAAASASQEHVLGDVGVPATASLVVKQNFKLDCQ